LLSENAERFETLVNIIARLRGPDGCPWDKKQTHQSLRNYLMEESFEALEALDEGDPDKLRQELGDLLLQIVLQAQIASQSGEFELEDVLKNINEKLVRRHPHVFGTVKVQDADEVSHNWEEIKKQERGKDVSLLSSVPRSLPALAYALEISRRAVQAGFEWPNLEGVIDKLVEEIKEFRQSGDSEKKSEEFGDLLFTLVNYARWEGLDAEAALRQANLKFYRRFTRMEELCRQRGLDFAKLSFNEQNALWDEVKREGK
jgi:tetrapyrrole methylase family protein / MazG family protein